MSSAEKVLADLRAAILRGEYSPRQRLVESELAEDYEASRFIVRKALVQLSTEGLVDMQPNRGARVREISVDDAIAVTEVRRALEGLVAGRAARRATAADIEKLRELAAAMQDAVRRFEVVQYSEVNAALHSALREIADHQPTTRILEQLNAQIVQHQFVLALVPGRPAVALREHLAIIDAVCARDADAAESAMRAHIASVIAALESFREGGPAARTGIRELARKINPRARHNAPTVEPSVTVTYGADSPSQVFDLYLPDQPRGPLPVVLTIHGGAFMMGDRTWELAAVPDLLNSGFAVASVDYRLSGEAPFPAAIRDAKRATAHLRSHAAEWGLDPSFFAAWGRSAGGYLAAMLGVTSGLGTEFDAPGEDSSVQAVVDWYGPSDFLQMDAQFQQQPPTGDGPPVQAHDTPDSPESRFLGAPIQDVPDLAARANPINYLASAGVVPPFFLATGTNDRLVPYQQTVILAEALRAHGTEVVSRVLRDASHADHQFETNLAGPVIEWLKSLYASR